MSDIIDNIDEKIKQYDNHFIVGFNNDFEKFELIVSEQLKEILTLYKDKLLMFSKENGDDEYMIAIGLSNKNEPVKEYDDESDDM